MKTEEGKKGTRVFMHTKAQHTGKELFKIVLSVLAKVLEVLRRIKRRRHGKQNQFICQLSSSEKIILPFSVWPVQHLPSAEEFVYALKLCPGRPAHLLFIYLHLFRYNRMTTVMGKRNYLLLQVNAFTDQGLNNKSSLNCMNKQITSGGNKIHNRFHHVIISFPQKT